MRRIEVSLPDFLIETGGSLSQEDVDNVIDSAGRLLQLSRRQDEAKLRKLFAWFLLGAGTVVLATSLGLVVLQAFDISNLSDTAVITLIGSVAVEFIGMLWTVVRYLFKPQGMDATEKRERA